MRQVLLIEDSPEYQLLIRAALSDRFDVMCVGDAEAALASISQQKPDLILLEVGLPGRDGLAFCLELRRDSRLRSTPIISSSRFIPRS